MVRIILALALLLTLSFGASILPTAPISPAAGNGVSVYFMVLDPLPDDEGVHGFVNSSTVLYGDYIEVVAENTHGNITASINGTPLELVAEAVEPSRVVAVFRAWAEPVNGSAVLEVRVGNTTASYNITYAAYAPGWAKVLANPSVVEINRGFAVVEEPPQPAEVTYPIAPIGGGDEILPATYPERLEVEAIGLPEGSAEIVWVDSHGNYFESGYSIPAVHGYAYANLTAINVTFLHGGFYTVGVKAGGDVLVPTGLGGRWVMLIRPAVDIDPDGVALRGDSIKVYAAGYPLGGFSIHVSAVVGPARIERDVSAGTPMQGIVEVDVPTDELIPPDAVAEASLAEGKPSEGEVVAVEANISISALGTAQNVTVYSWVAITSVDESTRIVVEKTYPSDHVVAAVSVDGGVIGLALFIHNRSVQYVVPENLIEDRVVGGEINVTFHGRDMEALAVHRLVIGVNASVAYPDLDGDGKGEAVPVAEVPVVGGASFVSVSAALYLENETTVSVEAAAEPARPYMVDCNVSYATTIRAAVVKPKLVQAPQPCGPCTELEKEIEELRKTIDEKASGLAAVVDEKSGEIVAVLRNTTLKVKVDPEIANEIRKMIEDAEADVLRNMTMQILALKAVEEASAARLEEAIASINASGIAELVETRAAEINSGVKALRAEVSLLEKYAEAHSRHVDAVAELVDSTRSRLDTLYMLTLANLAMIGITLFLVVAAHSDIKKYFM